jgi:predicted Zn-dependent peptidase
MAATIDRGTSRRSDDAIAEEVTLLQADLDGLAGRNFQGLRTEMVGGKFWGALDLFLDILFHPRFGRAEVGQERNVLLRELEIQKDYFESLAGNLFLQTLYPGHPYGLNLLGESGALRKIGTKELREHHRCHFRPDRTVIAVAGNVDPIRLRENLEEAIPGRSKGAGARIAPPPLTSLAGLHEVRRPIQGEKAYVHYGFRGARLDGEDRFALDVLAALLSSAGGGRLYVRLREELGMVYSVDASVVSGLEDGFVAISLNTAPEKVEQALEEVRAEIGRVREEVLSPAELERVKNFIVGAYEIDLQRSGPQAAQLCLGELYGTERTLGDYVAGVRRVTSRAVREAAHRFLTPDRGALVILSPMVH